MNFAYRDIPVLLTLEEGRPYVITIEHPFLLREMAAALIKQTNGEEGKFVLSDQGKILPIAKNVEFFTSPFQIDPNDKTLLKKFYMDLEETAQQEELFQATQTIKTQISKYIFDLLYQSGQDASCDLDIDLRLLFSAAGVKFSCDDDDFIERLVRTLHIRSQFLKINIFVFMNLSCFLTEEELQLLYKEAAYNEIQLILLEKSYQRISEMEKILLVDSEYCIVHCDS